jgi:ABC-type Zn2+ transport system substrate-binding protein/surface adhesin
MLGCTSQHHTNRKNLQHKISPLKTEPYWYLRDYTYFNNPYQIFTDLKQTTYYTRKEIENGVL